MKRDPLTHEIIGSAMEVHRSLGPGFLESIYKKALLHELGLKRIPTTTEHEVQITYKGVVVGRHRIDIFVEDKVIVELKAIAGIGQVQIAQVLSYLKATGTEVGLVINFGEECLRWKRIARTREFHGF